MLNLSVRRLAIFKAVVEAGSFAAAADRLNIAQPSVSAHIDALESALGGRLFERRRGSAPTLTDFGRLCIAHARDMIGVAERMTRDVQDYRGATRASVIFACQRSLATATLSGALADFIQLHRDIGVTLRIGYQEDVARQAREGEIDVACLLSNAEIPGLTTDVIGREELVLIAPQGHPLAQGRKVAPAEIAKADFVGAPPSSTVGNEVVRVLQRAGVHRIRSMAQATDYPSLRAFVVAGIGISCTLRKAITDDAEPNAPVIIDLDGPPLFMDVRLARPPERASAAVATFTRFLVERLRERE
jgi:DNA-binding transcriptional LysR family regulator